MNKVISPLLVISGLIATPVWAEVYSGIGLGAGEVCEGVGDSNFSQGDCGNYGVVLRGFLGGALTDYVRLEGTLEALFDPQYFFGLDGDSQVTAATLGGYLLLNLPLSGDASFFAGPGMGASMVHVSDEQSRIYYNTSTQESYEVSGGDTTFGLNYGWTLGIDFETLYGGAMRIQWQTWNSMDSDVLFGKEFSTNYLSLSLTKGF